MPVLWRSNERIFCTVCTCWHKPTRVFLQGFEVQVSTWNSHRNSCNRAGKFIFCLKVPLQYPMRYTVLMKWDEVRLSLTDWKDLGGGHCYCMELHIHCMNTQFHNLNFMAQSNDNRQKKDNESRINVYMIKSCHLKVRISFTVVVLFCIFSRSNNHNGVRHQLCPSTHQKPEAQTSKQPKKHPWWGSPLSKFHLSTYCLYFDAFVQKNLSDN